jgi:hypothetical protein
MEWDKEKGELLFGLRKLSRNTLFSKISIFMISFGCLDIRVSSILSVESE